LARATSPVLVSHDGVGDRLARAGEGRGVGGLGDAEGGVDQVDPWRSRSAVFRAVPLRDAVPVAVFLKKVAVTSAAVVRWLAVAVDRGPDREARRHGAAVRPLMPVSASVTAGLARATSPVLVRPR